MDINTQVSFILYICFKICHLKVIVDKVYHKIREPRVLTLRFKQTTEKFQALLSKVIAEDFEGHKSRVLSQTLGEESQTKVIDVIVSHVEVDQRLIHSKSLSNCLCPIV